MHSLQIKNIRSLTDTGPIRIAPITLLVGQNSSGKSTFARFLPLLKQGGEARTREPFLWLGRLVDFGSVQEAYSRFSTDRQLGISIEQKVPGSLLDARRRSALYARGEPQPAETVKLSINYSVSERATPLTFTFSFEYRSQAVVIEMDTGGKISSLHINGSDFSNSAFCSMFVSSWTGPFPTFELNEESVVSGRYVSGELHKFVRSNLDGRTSDERASSLVRALVAGSILTLQERALSATAGDAYWKRQVSAWAPDSPSATRLRNLVVAQQFFGEVGAAVVSQVRRSLANIRYITPLRASAERYYRLQGLSVEEIDPQGQNIAMFIYSLSIAERASFSSWMTRFFGVAVETKPSQGHVSLFLSGKHGDGGYNLADTGFGYSQMLPILVQLWSAGARKTGSPAFTSGPVIFSIEQPELHLHPKLQAKLAEVFLAAVSAAREIDVDLRLVIETHSEQIISTLGLHVARATTKADEINIVLFEKESMDVPTRVRETSFSVDGVLKTWPFGFFEANV